MFCSKCHTEIREEDINYCPRCGQRVENKRTNNHFYFGSKIKNTKNEHEDQYEYSKDYSNVTKDETDSHQKQYSYGKKYSNIKKETPDEHITQYDYSKKYSDVTKDEADEHEKQYNYSSNYSEMNTINITSEEDYIKAYINNNYNSIKNKKFNVGALIFGPIYCIYRKMYLLGIILLFIETSFLLTIGGDYLTLIELFINLYLAIKINEIYLKKVENNVERIKNNNPDKTSKELIKICSNKGGTISIKIFVIILVIIPIIISILRIIFEFQTYNEQEENHTSTEIYNIRDINYKKPNNFIEISSSNQHNYLISNDNKCYVNAFSISNTGDIREYLSNNSSSSSYTNKTDILIWEHKGTKWYYIMMNSSYGDKNIYVSNYNNYRYVFTFEGDCKEYQPDILNSIEYNKTDE